MNETDIKMGRIMFHAFKAMLTKYKCAFNRRLAIYELRSFKTKINSNNIEPIDWNSAPFIPNHKTIKQWDISHIEKIVERIDLRKTKSQLASLHRGTTRHSLTPCSLNVILINIRSS